MKKIILSFLIFMLVSACTVASLPVYAQAEHSAKVVAYYFYSAIRCPTCHKLEQYSKEAIERNLNDALDSGKLEFKAVNTDEKGNEHFLNDYQLYTKSLVISVVENGREVKSKNLTQIWQLVGNKQKYYDYVTGEINEFLKGV